MMRVLLTIFACLLTGCLLSEEPCGLDFKVVEGRCVPLQAPPPFRASSDPSEDATPRDGAVRDLGLRLEPVFDASPVELLPDAGPEPVEDEWSAYSVILVVDRTPDGSANRTPALPGADIDAVEVLGPDDGIIGVADAVIDARINDPYEASIQTEPRSALGRADDRSVSLGTQGGFVRLSLSTERPITRAARVRVVEVEEAFENEDTFEVFLCRADSEGLSGCRPLGTSADGTTIFPLD